MVSIKKGSVMLYRVFDIAEEVNLSMVEELLKSEGSRSRLKFTLPPRQIVIMRNAPVTLSLGEAGITLHEKTIRAEVFAKIWDYGVLSILFQIPIEPGTTWDQLIDLSAKIDTDTLLDDAARVRAQELASLIQVALREPHYWHDIEDYVIFFFEEVNIGKRKKSPIGQ